MDKGVPDAPFLQEQKPRRSQKSQGHNYINLTQTGALDHLQGANSPCWVKF